MSEKMSDGTKTRRKRNSQRPVEPKIVPRHDTPRPADPNFVGWLQEACELDGRGSDGAATNRSSRAAIASSGNAGTKLSSA